MKRPEGKPTLAEAVMELAAQFRRYNDLNEPQILGDRPEAELFRASYDDKSDEKRELRDFLRGKEAESLGPDTPKRKTGR